MEIKLTSIQLEKVRLLQNTRCLFSSGKEIVTLNLQFLDRTLYSEGALTAAQWLSRKKPGLYSMRNLLNF